MRADSRSLSVAMLGGAVILVVFAVLVARPESSPALAQCDPATGQCCGLPGLPPCPPPKRPTEVPTNTPRPTSTATATPTATITLTPTATNTLIPTSTPYPTPTPPPPPFPLLPPIIHLIGNLHWSDNTSIPLPSWLQPDNLQMTDVEITQAIQCLHNPDCPDNSVPLYQGKLTMVRAYVRLNAGPDSFVYPIGGALCYGDTGKGGCSNPIRPVSKIFVQNVADPVSYGRQVLSATLDFILPLSFVESPVAQKITVYVNYNFEDLPQESFYKDNDKVLQYQVQSSEKVGIRFFAVQNNGTFPPAGEWSTITDWLNRVYPTNDVEPYFGFPLYGKNYPWGDKDGGCGKGWGTLLDDLWWARNGNPQIAYGLVDTTGLKGSPYSGCGNMGDPEAAGEVVGGTLLGARIAAQEVGHTLNLPHVPGCGAGGPDMNYPKPNGQLDEVGVDVARLVVYGPSWSYDFMGYCGGSSNSWTSIYTYNEIAGLLPAGASTSGSSQLASLAPLPLQASKYLVGSGQLSPTKATVTHGFYVLGNDSVQSQTPDKGPYTLEMLAFNGKVVQTWHFDVSQMSNEEPQSEGAFRLVIPWVDGTTRLVFKYQDKVIGQVNASSHAPVVKLTSPAAGEHWPATGSQTITWTGTDADRNPLTYIVQYSRDGGKTWIALATNLDATSLTIDTTYLPGAQQGIIRVFATDGLNTASDQSSPIQADSKAPLVHIASPVDGQEIDAGSPIVLRGVASDFQDGPLSGGALNWTLETGAPLGSGNQSIVPGLPSGEHTITLKVTNAEGMSASASVHIVVKGEAAVTPSPTRPSIFQWWPWALICLVGVLLIVGLVSVIRARSRKPQAS